MRSLTTPSLWSINLDISTETFPVEIPNFSMPPFASLYSSDACNRAFDGMQPTLRQVPPSAPRISTQATLSPS